MKMAKATAEDLKYAWHLCHFLEALRGGGEAKEAVEEFDLSGYSDLVDRVATDEEYLLRAFELGGLHRVVMGMETLLDPANQVVDPNLDYLELHPRFANVPLQPEAAPAAGGVQ